MTQHKWHKEIKAWADGAQIEYRNLLVGNDWVDCTDTPQWITDDAIQYRIKKEPVITVEYFQKTNFQGYTCYIAFTPDLEPWDLKITYIDGVADKVEIN